MKLNKINKKLLVLALSSTFILSGAFSVGIGTPNFVASALTDTVVANSGTINEVQLENKEKTISVTGNSLGDSYLLVDIDRKAVMGYSSKFKSTDKPLTLEITNGGNTYTTEVKEDTAEYSSGNSDLIRFYVPCGNAGAGLSLKIKDPNKTAVVTDKFNVRVYSLSLDKNKLVNVSDYANIANNDIETFLSGHDATVYKGFIFNKDNNTLLLRPNTNAGNIRLYLSAGDSGFRYSSKKIKVKYFSEKSVYDKIKAGADTSKFLKSEYQEHDVSISSSFDSVTLPWYPENGIIELSLYNSNNFLLNLKVEAVSESINVDGPSVTPTPDPEKPLNINVTRFSSVSRYDTALALSKEAFLSSKVAVIANGENFADALSGGPLAAINKAPLLLVKENMSLDSIKAELDRLGVEKLFVLGGENSISMKVETKLAVDKNDKMRTVIRLGGKDRYDTSSKIYYEFIKNKDTKNNMILVNGKKFADALSAGPAAIKTNRAILLVDGKNAVSPVSKKDDKNLLIGGVDSIDSSFAGVRVSGKDRYETSSLLARGYFENAKNVIVSSGEKYPDGLSSITLYNKFQAPLLLVEKNSLPTYIKAYLKATSPEKAYVVGGTDSVSTSVVTEISKLTK